MAAGRPDTDVTQAQGVVLPLDPYKTLELHPAAPRNLIDEVYWALAARARRSQSPAARAHLAVLNDAYEILAQDDSRVAWDEKHGLRADGTPPAAAALPRKKGLFGGGRATAASSLLQRTHYETLHVDPDATDEVIRLASSLLLQKATTSREEDAVRRAEIQRASQTLLDPQRRGEYDTSIGRAVAGTATAAPPSPVAAPEGRPASLAPGPKHPNGHAVTKGHAAANVNGNGPALGVPAGAPGISPASDEGGLAICGWAGAVEPRKHRSLAPAALATGPGVIDAETADSAPAVALALAAPPIATAGTIAAQTLDAAAAPAMPQPVEAPAFPVEAAAVEAVPPPVDDPAPSSRALETATAAPAAAAPAAAGFIARLRQRVAGEAPGSAAPHRMSAADVRAELLEREHARLLTLRDAPAGEAYGAAARPDSAEPAEAPPPAFDDAPAVARLDFVAGRRAGASVPLDGERTTIGAGPHATVVLSDEDGSVAPEHACIWQQGDSFLFRHVDGDAVTIGGQPLSLPVVVLEDGDEIAIGANRIVFREAPRHPLATH